MPKKVNHQDRRVARAVYAVKVMVETGLSTMRLADVCVSFGFPYWVIDTLTLPTCYFEKLATVTG